MDRLQCAIRIPLGPLIQLRLYAELEAILVTVIDELKPVRLFIIVNQQEVTAKKRPKVQVAKSKTPVQ